MNIFVNNIWFVPFLFIFGILFATLCGISGTENPFSGIKNSESAQNSKKEAVME